MDVAAPHFGFVLAAYIVGLGGIGALAAFILMRDRTWRDKMDRSDRDAN